MAVQDLERIEQKIDRAAAGAIAVSDSIGGIMFSNMSEVLEFAKLMAIAGTAVPKHLRGNPGQCLAVTIQALEWRSSPFAVANKSYEVNDRIAYEAQLIHAVIEARAPLKQRLRYKYEGDGQERLCVVTGHFKGELEAVEYRSPTIAKIKVKNSPLWVSDPDQQLAYYSARAWARRHAPDVLLGIYTEEELSEVGADNARDVTPGRPDVASRLKGRAKGARGFDHDGVTAALERKPGEIVPEVAKQAESAVIEAKPIEEQMTLSAGDVETEIEAKKQALRRIETKDDLDAIVAASTKFLRENKRQDLLSDFLSAAKDAGKRFEK